MPDMSEVLLKQEISPESHEKHEDTKNQKNEVKVSSTGMIMTFSRLGYFLKHTFIIVGKQGSNQEKGQNKSQKHPCQNCSLSFDTFELFCEHMLDSHNELKEKEENGQHNKHNCIFCDLNFHFFEELQSHYSKKHIYCQECNELLTDEDALHKHNLKEHGGLS